MNEQTEQNELALTLESEYSRVARLRVETNKLNDRKKRLHEEFLRDNVLLFDEYERNRTLLNTAEENLRKLAVDEYKETGKKTLFGNVRIKMMSNLEYDKDNAFDWAVQHKMCLTLDSKSFEKVMNSQNKLPEFVKKVETPQATIPRIMEDDK